VERGRIIEQPKWWRPGYNIALLNLNILIFLDFFLGLPYSDSYLTPIS
jgi:hypothetical protein